MSIIKIVKILIRDFSGMVPKTGAASLPENAALWCENCKFVGGDIRSYQVALATNPSTHARKIPNFNDAYKSYAHVLGFPNQKGRGSAVFRFLGATQSEDDANYPSYVYFAGATTTDASFARSVIPNDIHQRVYFTRDRGGDIGLKVYRPETENYGGEDYLFDGIDPRIFDARVPSPAASSWRTRAPLYTYRLFFRTTPGPGTTPVNHPGDSSDFVVEVSVQGAPGTIVNSRSQSETDGQRENRLFSDALAGATITLEIEGLEGNQYVLTRLLNSNGEQRYSSNGRAYFRLTSTTTGTTLNSFNTNFPEITPASAGYRFTISRGRTEVFLENRTYVMTLVLESGEESKPSAVNAELHGERGVLKGAPISVVVGGVQIQDDEGNAALGSASPPVSAIRLYRSSSGTSNAAFLFLDEIAVADLSESGEYLDVVDDEFLGEPLPSALYDDPPDDLKYLRTFSGGVMVGASGEQLCFSYPNQPHAWPALWRQNFAHEITAIEPVSGGLVVATEEDAYFVTGSSPDAMVVNKLNTFQGCINPQGSVAIEKHGMVYPSPDGLVSLSSSQQSNILTEDVVERLQWQVLYRPDSCFSHFYNNMYLTFFREATTNLRKEWVSDIPQVVWEDIVHNNLSRERDIVGWQFMPSHGSLSFLNERVLFGATRDFDYSDIRSIFRDTYHDIIGAMATALGRARGAHDRVVFFDVGGTNLNRLLNIGGVVDYENVPFVWRSKLFSYPSPKSFVCARLFLPNQIEQNNFTFRVYAGTEPASLELVNETTGITDNDPIYFDKPAFGRFFIFEVEGEGVLRSIEIAENPYDMGGV